MDNSKSDPLLLRLERGVLGERGVLLDERGVLEERDVLLNERGVLLDERGLLLGERGVLLGERKESNPHAWVTNSNDCDNLLKEVIDKLKTNDISLDFKEFNNILNKCDKLSNIHSVGFIIVNDIEKNLNKGQAIEKLFDYKVPMK